MTASSRDTKTYAFTLVELLITLGIVGMLALLGAAGVSKAKKKAQQALEISAAGNLMTAYHLYSQDHNGQLMPGYRDDPDVANFEGSPLYRRPICT